MRVAATRTPLVTVALTIDGRRRRVRLKLEGFNPNGSLKDRTASSLVASLDRRGALGPGSNLVESTSGNLGIALAAIARRRGLRFTAVVDPRATRENLDRLLALGARVDRVETPDASGCYLGARIARVLELCESSDAFVWPDQYSNEANPRGHETGTAPELLEQSGDPIDAIFVPVGTGGTLAGISRCLRRENPRTRIVAVDVVGSAALGGRSAPRLLTGIGAGRRSAFLSARSYDERIMVGDVEAFGWCRLLAGEAGFRVGGSSGAVLAACARAMRRDPALDGIVCLCPDRGDSYETTIFSDPWLIGHGIDPAMLDLGRGAAKVRPAAVAIA